MWLREDIAEELLARIEESDKAISGAAARDKIMWSQTGIFMDMGMANKKVMQQGLELYQQTMGQFRQDMMGLVSRFQTGTMGIPQALAAFKSISGRYYQTLFKAGAMSMGNPYYADPAIGLTKKDLAFISSARRAEGRFFKRFLLDMSNPNHVPVHPYAKRAGYYADSGKAQFFNGMVNGAGENVEISWVLGTVEEHCHDCPVLASKTYTWQTLPTTPGAGDTECLFNCACHLEFHKRQSGTGTQGGLPMMPGSATPAATEAPGRWSKVTVGGVDMEGMLVKEFDDMFAQMNKARQMTHITTGEVRKEWIQTRRALNDAIIQRAKQGGYRVTPTTSVIDLLAAVDRATSKGLTQVFTIDTVVNNQQIAFLRGDVLMLGKISIINNNVFVNTSKGTQFRYSEKSDILLGVPSDAKPAPAPVPMAPAEPAPAPVIAAAPEVMYREFDQYNRHSTRWTDTAFQEASDIVAVSDRYTTGQHIAIRDYGGFGYTGMNGYLREGNVIGDWGLRTTKSRIHQMDAAMVKGQLTEDIVLHRVSNVENFGTLRVGKVFTDPGFVSASTQMEGTESMMRSTKWRLRILVPEGTPAVSMPKALGRLATVVDELEIVLPRSSQFKVIEVDQHSRIMTIELVKAGTPGRL
jgi:hypothetical protein